MQDKCKVSINLSAPTKTLLDLQSYEIHMEICSIDFRLLALAYVLYKWSHGETVSLRLDFE